MEKYSTGDSSLLRGLLEEESALMCKVQGFMGNPEKRASAELSSTESRLQQVRAKITELEKGPQ